MSETTGIPRSFLLVRDEDETGVSGTGTVAQGIEFSDGTVALRWMSEWPTSVVFHDRGIAAVEQVHGKGREPDLPDLPDLRSRHHPRPADRTRTELLFDVDLPEHPGRHRSTMRP